MLRLLIISAYIVSCVLSLPAGDYSPDKGKNSAGGKLAFAVAKLQGNQKSGASPSNPTAPSTDTQIVNNDVPSDDGKYSPEKGKSSSASKLASAVAKMKGNRNTGGSAGGPGETISNGSGNISQASNMPTETNKDSPAWRISEAFVKYQAANGGK